MVYIYPENLKAAPHPVALAAAGPDHWRALAVLGQCCSCSSARLPGGGAGRLYLFLTIRFEDACILDFIRKAAVYFLLKPQRYRWVSPLNRR